MFLLTRHSISAVAAMSEMSISCHYNITSYFTVERIIRTRNSLHAFVFCLLLTIAKRALGGQGKRLWTALSRLRGTMQY